MPISKQTINDMIDQLKHGTPTNVLATKYSCSKSYIRHLLNAHQPTKWIECKGIKKIGKGEHSKIASEYLDGFTTIELANKYKVTTSTIRTILKKTNTSTRPKGRPLSSMTLAQRLSKKKISYPIKG